MDDKDGPCMRVVLSTCRFESYLSTLIVKAKLGASEAGTGTLV